MLLCEIDYILKQPKIVIFIEFRISIHVGFWTWLKQGSLR